LSSSLFSVLPLPPPPSPLFPYTTLFRSPLSGSSRSTSRAIAIRLSGPLRPSTGCVATKIRTLGGRLSTGRPAPERRRSVEGHLRSEEHTSELQSRENLVCRLLLEKKKSL